MRAWFTGYAVYLNSDLNDRNVISDLFAAGNEGANGKRIVQCNANTLNTPYKAGLTGGASGTAYLNISSAAYGTILYIASGSNRMFLACKAGGAWGDWTEVVTNADLQTEYNVTNNNIVFRCEANDGSAIQLATTTTQLQLQKRTSATGSWEIVWAK